MKLYELAKVVKQDNKVLQEFLAKQNMPVKSHLSPLNAEQVELLTKEFGDEKEAVALKNQVADAVNFKHFNDDDMIPCRSVRGNRVIFASDRTNRTYDWLQYDQIVHVAYIDLLGLFSRQSDYLFKPMILIEDEDLYLQWRSKLEPIYTHWIGLDNPEEVFQKDDTEFEKLVASAPAAMKELFGTTAAKLLKHGGNITVRKVQILDDLCGTALRDLYQ